MTGFRKTLQKGFRRTGNPDLVNDISRYACCPTIIIYGIIQGIDYYGWEWFKFYNTVPLSEKFIRKFQDKVNWDWISTCRKFSETFIREFQDRVHWQQISHFQNLSESFIREFQDKVNWESISIKQVFSESFIREFQDKVYWRYILLPSNPKNISKSFQKEFQHKNLWKLTS